VHGKRPPAALVGRCLGAQTYDAAVAVVPAAAQALAVLRYLGTQAQPAAAAAIGRELGLPRSTTYHLLDTLIRAGFVVHVAEERRYALGVAVYELASGYARQTSLQRLARAPLATLVDNIGQNAHLAIMHGRDVIYVIEERATGRPPLITDVGVRLPAHLTASGRAMLALMPAAQVRALYSDPGSFVLRNDRGPRSLSALRHLLTEARQRGFASEDGEVTPEFASVAVAATDRAGYPAAAVAVTFPSAESDTRERERLAARAARTAGEVSRRLGAAHRSLSKFPCSYR
jgi:DNA-binding IclR family transcriptional regulator